MRKPLQDNPESVSVLVTRLRRLFRDAYGQELRIAQPRPGFRASRVEIVIHNALASVNWSPKPRLKSGLYSEKEYNSAWSAISNIPEVMERRAKLQEIEKKLKSYGQKVKYVLDPRGALILNYSVNNWDYYPNRYAHIQGLSHLPMTVDTLRQAKTNLLDALDLNIEGYSAFLDPRLYDGSGTPQEATFRLQGKRGVRSDWFQRYLETFWNIDFPRFSSEKVQHGGENPPDAYAILRGERSIDDLFRWQAAKKKDEEKKDISYVKELKNRYHQLSSALVGMSGKKPTLGNVTRWAPRVKMDIRSDRDKVYAVIFVAGHWVGIGPERASDTEAIAAAISFAQRMNQAIDTLKGDTTKDEFERLAARVRAEVPA